MYHLSVSSIPTQRAPHLFYCCMVTSVCPWPSPHMEWGLPRMVGWTWTVSNPRSCGKDKLKVESLELWIDRRRVLLSFDDLLILTCIQLYAYSNLTQWTRRKAIVICYRNVLASFHWSSYQSDGQKLAGSPHKTGRHGWRAVHPPLFDVWTYLLTNSSFFSTDRPLILFSYRGCVHFLSLTCIDIDRCTCICLSCLHLHMLFTLTFLIVFTFGCIACP